MSIVLEVITTRTVPIPTGAGDMLRAAVAAGERTAGRRLAGRRARQAAAAEAEHAAQVLQAGACTEVHVTHDTAPALITHEHGVLVLIPAEPDTTLMLDICSVDGDPRWSLHLDGGLLRHDWRWLRLGKFGSYGFTADGPMIDPMNLGDLHGTELERALTEGDDGWPGDDAILRISFTTAIALATS